METISNCLDVVEKLFTAGKGLLGTYVLILGGAFVGGGSLVFLYAFEKKIPKSVFKHFGKAVIFALTHFGAVPAVLFVVLNAFLAIVIFGWITIKELLRN